MGDKLKLPAELVALARHLHEPLDQLLVLLGRLRLFVLRRPLGSHQPSRPFQLGTPVAAHVLTLVIGLGLAGQRHGNLSFAEEVNTAARSNKGLNKSVPLDELRMADAPT
jgi:hypothetical protein